MNPEKGNDDRNGDLDSLKITTDDGFMNYNDSYLNEYDGYSTAFDSDVILQATSNYPLNEDQHFTQTSNGPKRLNALLNKMEIMIEENSGEGEQAILKIQCHLWTKGFDRSFKVSNKTALYSQAYLCIK